MKALFSKKSIITLSILLAIDIIMIGCWTLYSQPDESMTIILLFIIPMVFLANLMIAGIFYFIKIYYTPFFVINAFLSSFLVYLFFVQYIEIDKGIGNFRFIDKMDKLFSTPTKKRGRYIYYIGRIYK